jgi:hypothetical protein
MTKHTPGPWKFKTAANGDNGISAYDTGIFAEAFADVRHAGENNREEALANARLIAAAPEMLEALDIVVGCLLWNKQDEASIEVMRRVNSVRAKAEGRS